MPRTAGDGWIRTQRPSPPPRRPETACPHSVGCLHLKGLETQPVTAWDWTAAIHFVAPRPLRTVTMWSRGCRPIHISDPPTGMPPGRYRAARLSLADPARLAAVPRHLEDVRAFDATAVSLCRAS